MLWMYTRPCVLFAYDMMVHKLIPRKDEIMIDKARGRRRSDVANKALLEAGRRDLFSRI